MFVYTFWEKNLGRCYLQPSSRLVNKNPQAVTHLGTDQGRHCLTTVIVQEHIYAYSTW